LVGLLLVVALTLLSVGSVAAARANGHSSSTTATLTVLSPVPAYSYFHGQGCGYVVGTPVNMVLRSGTSDAFFPVGVDGSGCISFDYYSGGPGSYVLDAYQGIRSRQQTLEASTTFTIN